MGVKKTMVWTSFTLPFIYHLVYNTFGMKNYKVLTSLLCNHLKCNDSDLKKAFHLTLQGGNVSIQFLVSLDHLFH